MKQIKLLLSVFLLSLIFTIQTFAGQWEGDYESGWKYLKDDGTYVLNDWLILGDEETYHFDNNGIMQIGLAEVDGKKYYFYNDGRLTYNWNTPEGYKVDNNGNVIEDFSSGITFLFIAGQDASEPSNMAACRIENESSNDFYVNPIMKITTDGMVKEFIMVDLNTMNSCDYGVVKAKEVQYFTFFDQNLQDFSINSNTIYTIEFEYNQIIYTQDAANMQLYRFHFD